MILELGINRVAKQVSSQDFRDGLQNLRDLARQASAEDKMGSFTAGAEILILSVLISAFAYSTTLKIFPNNFLNYFRQTKSRLNEKYNPEKQDPNAPKPRDIMDLLQDFICYGLGGGSLAGGGILYIKKKRKAARQRAMEQALQEEMDRLKEHLEQEINETATSAAGVVDNKSSLLSGANIVELFNSFAELMAIQGDLPRHEEETALEYFNKVAEKINFPREESLKAAVYFDDELYGKKNSTKEDKAAFMKLILEMISRVNKSNAAAAAKK